MVGVNQSSVGPRRRLAPFDRTTQACPDRGNVCWLLGCRPNAGHWADVRDLGGRRRRRARSSGPMTRRERASLPPARRLRRDAATPTHLQAPHPSARSPADRARGRGRRCASYVSARRRARATASRTPPGRPLREAGVELAVDEVDGDRVPRPDRRASLSRSFGGTLQIGDPSRDRRAHRPDGRRRLPAARPGGRRGGRAARAVLPPRGARPSPARRAPSLNLGGIANLTWLPAAGEPGRASSRSMSGPANALVDGRRAERMTATAASAWTATVRARFAWRGRRALSWRVCSTTTT